LATVEQHILSHHCTVGHISYRYDRFVRRGTVLTLSPHGGTFANASAVNIVVSRGARPHRHRHHSVRG
jgi:hypothetical protein